ncbi:MAG: hypothetical protein GF313_08590 [Caldithrix sp.]|nr:hypothetical protein [Caldithrix sp.]
MMASNVSFEKLLKDFNHPLQIKDECRHKLTEIIHAKNADSDHGPDNFTGEQTFRVNGHQFYVRIKQLKIGGLKLGWLAHLARVEDKENEKNRNQRPDPVRALVHNARTPLSTSLMAVKNIQFLIDHADLDRGHKDEVYEFINTATQALDDTQKILHQISLLNRNNKDTFSKIHIKDVLYRVIDAHVSEPNQKSKIPVRYGQEFSSDEVLGDEQSLKAIFDLTLDYIENLDESNPDNRTECSLTNEFDRYLGSCAIVQFSKDRDDQQHKQIETDISRNDSLMIANRILANHDGQLQLNKDRHKYVCRLIFPLVKE